MLHIELVSTGSELLIGKTVNTHASVLGGALRDLGLRLQCDVTIGDDYDTMRRVIEEGLQRSDILFVSGGLGPTCDDITRDVLADLLNDTMTHDEGAVKRIQDFCDRMGRTMSENQKRQALVLSRAEVLENGVGAASGQLLRKENKLIFVLPGPPREFRHVLEHGVLPALKREGLVSDVAPEHLFQVCMGESDISVRVAQAGLPDEVNVAYCAAERGVEVRLSVCDQEVLRQAADAVRKELGNAVYAEDHSSMAEVVGRLLRERGMTLATAESCTGGLVGHQLTGVPGSSEYYLGGVVAYSNALKEQFLGVSRDVLVIEGAVSAEVAEEMACGIRLKTGADFGIGITGIAGPGGGTADKPVGLVYIAVANAERCTVEKCVFGRVRDRTQRLASQVALNLLRLRILNP